jgi:outer membrane translocation and assembly module TamA
LLVVSLPPLPGSRWRFGSTMRYFEGPNPSEPESFDQIQYSASLEATFERSASDALRGYYEIRRTENTFVCADPDDPFCMVQTIEVIESILGSSFLRDRMDNLFDPRSGHTLSLDLSTNRPEVGSDLSDARALLGLGLALEPLDDWTWAHRLQLGWAKGFGGAEINSERRFYAGGQGTIRGFDRDTVGPVDLGADFTLTPAGGGALAILNQELRIPVWGPVRAAVFVDVGQVWDTWSEADLDLAVGAGLGVRISTPVGPIWADVAWPVANEGVLTSRGAKFYLGIGRPF